MTLYLLPNVLGHINDFKDQLPQNLELIVAQLDGLIAESSVAGRRFLSKFETKVPYRNIPIAVLNTKDINFLLEPVVKGEKWGLVSDAGLPCVADPGSSLVLKARSLGIPIKAFSGPSSITMSLMLSGLPGQRFSFKGYISKDPKIKVKELKELEKVSAKESSTQIFIEAPYRNTSTLLACLDVLQIDTKLSVAFALTTAEEQVDTRTVKQWRAIEDLEAKLTAKNFNKQPAIFLLNATRVDRSGR